MFRPHHAPTSRLTKTVPALTSIVTQVLMLIQKKNRRKQHMQYRNTLDYMTKHALSVFSKGSSESQQSLSTAFSELPTPGFKILLRHNPPLVW